MKSARYTPRYYPNHHFIFYPVMLLLFIWSTYRAFTRDDGSWAFIAAGFAGLTWLSYMLRQHYALGLQDRLIRLELRYRYWAATGKRFEPFEAQLSDKRLFALRFASDEELESLVEKAVREQWSAGRIRHHIKNWKPDLHRV